MRLPAAALLLLLALVAPVLMATPLRAETPVTRVETRIDPPQGLPDTAPAWPVVAALDGPTDSYAHNVLGRIPAFLYLSVTARACPACRHGSETLQVGLPGGYVFEDVAPRLWDVTGDARPEVVVVETDPARGARLAVWAYPDMASTGEMRHLAVTGFIGRPNRWLAPLGAADFDGDGRIEVAYVDRPHLLADLVFVRVQGDRLVEVARLPGVTNHRIGDEVITGGLRDCGQGPELVAASPDWARLLGIGWQGGPVARDLGAYSARAMARALDCR